MPLHHNDRATKAHVRYHFVRKKNCVTRDNCEYVRKFAKNSTASIFKPRLSDLARMQSLTPRLVRIFSKLMPLKLFFLRISENPKNFAGPKFRAMYRSNAVYICVKLISRTETGCEFGIGEFASIPSIRNDATNFGKVPYFRMLNIALFIEYDVMNIIIRSRRPHRWKPAVSCVDCYRHGRDRTNSARTRYSDMGPAYDFRRPL